MNEVIGVNPGSKVTHLPTVRSWLQNLVQKSNDERYYHRRLEEDLNFREAILVELQALMHQAHEDSRQRLRNAFDIPNSLDPLEEEVTPEIDTSIIDNFPRYLDLTTLKGYFGEVFSAIIAENFNSLDEDWTVPVFPFRYHQMAYHALEKIRQEGGSPPRIIGRFGDDMVAFQRNEQGRITHALVCEAKCSAGHDRSLIADAHKKSSDQKDVPVDCMQIAEILEEHEAEDPTACSWRKSIIRLWLEKTPTYERCDLVSYICGLPPVRSTTVVIPTEAPHTNYTAGRRLESVEVHLYDVNGLIEDVYKAIRQPLTCSLDSEQLTEIWERLISHIPERQRAVFQGHCCLLALEGNSVVIGVKTLQRYRDVCREKSVVKQALIDSGLVVLETDNERVDIDVNLKDLTRQNPLHISISS